MKKKCNFVYDANFHALLVSKLSINKSKPFNPLALDVGGRGGERNTPGDSPNHNGSATLKIPSFDLVDNHFPNSEGNTPLNHPHRQASHHKPSPTYPKSNLSKGGATTTGAGNNGLTPKMYHVPVTKDLVCYERIETVLQFIKDSHNSFCPYCLGCKIGSPFRPLC